MRQQLRPRFAGQATASSGSSLTLAEGVVSARAFVALPARPRSPVRVCLVGAAVPAVPVPPGHGPVISLCGGKKDREGG